MATLGATVTAQAWATLEQVGALTSVVFTDVSAPVRNLETGQTTAAGTPFTVDMLLRRFRREEIDGTQIVAGDMLGRLPKANLTATPTTRDTVTHAGIVWSIVAVEEGANGGWWRLHLRRPRPV